MANNTNITINGIQGTNGASNVKLSDILAGKTFDFVPKHCFAASTIKTIDLPDTITEIPEAAFCRCERLEKVTIPSSVTEIGKYAFYGCKNI